MAKPNYGIEAKVTLKEEGTGYEQVIPMPISLNEFLAIQKELKAKQMKVKDVEMNCDIFTELLQKESTDGMDFCSMLQGRIQELNVLSNPEEVQALIENFTDDIDKLLEFVQKGNYHFYPELTIENLEDGIATIGDGYMDYEQMGDYGYFESSTGIIYIPEKNTK